MSGVLHGVIASLKAAAAAATDAFFEYVSLLLNTTSTNGAQNNTFLDSSTNNFTVTRNGDTTQGSFNPYMPTGYWSGFFDGNGDNLSVARNVALNLSSGDFTIEAWVFWSGSNANSTIVNKDGLIASSYPSYDVSLNGSGFVICYVGSGNGTSSIQSITSNTLLPVNAWVHLAFVKNGTTLTLYQNGVSVASATQTATITDGGKALLIGYNAGQATGYYFNGYISNARVVKGTAVYTSAFTPPTTPLTAITNTSLLCLQDNRFKDNSANAFAITVNGDTRISKFAPLNPPASYSTASYGGSGYFDGTGDYLTTASSTSEAGNFTLEGWVNPSAAANGIVISWGSETANRVYMYVTNTGVLAWGVLAVGDYNLGGSVPVGAWSHIAIVRSGTTVTGYVNGTSVGTTAYSGTAGNTGGFGIGAGRAGGTPFTGYISNARAVQGTAVYTANFTPPTTPLTAITNTSLLLNFTNAGIFDAATINDGQTVGNAQVSTTVAKFGTTSMAFDGTGDYVTIIDKPELRLGTGDFTIEGWVYLTATGVAYGLVSKGTATTGWSVNVTSGNNLQFSYTASNLTGATALALGNWYYFAVVRSGTATGNLKLYLDSVLDATSAGAVTDNFNQTNVLYVGADRVAGAVLNGYLQDARITNGYARTITTPTAAFPTL